MHKATKRSKFLSSKLPSSLGVFNVDYDFFIETFEHCLAVYFRTPEKRGRGRRKSAARDQDETEADKDEPEVDAGEIAILDIIFFFLECAGVVIVIHVKWYKTHFNHFNTLFIHNDT